MTVGARVWALNQHAVRVIFMRNIKIVSTVGRQLRNHLQRKSNEPGC